MNVVIKKQNTMSKLIPKHQPGNRIEVPDKTHVNKPFIGDFVIEQLPYIDVPYEQKLDDYYNNQSYLSDKDVADYYGHLQDAYNDYVLGYGVTGSGTNYDPSTDYGREAILQNTGYALGNALNVAGLTIGLGGIVAMQGITPKRLHLGRISDYEPFKIGEGAEAMVYNNSPTTVGKITWLNPRRMLEKNNFPFFEPLEKRGVVFTKNRPQTVFLQRKLKIPSDEQIPKYLKKLDKKMEKKGYLAIDMDDEMSRIYKSPDGEWFMDDISPGNIGVDFFGRPKIIDFTPITSQDFADMYLIAE